MRRVLRQKRVRAGLGVLFTLVFVAGAVAYFTTSGSGTGTAAVGTASQLTIHGTSGTTLYPGVQSTVSFTVDNPSSGHQQLGTIHLASIKACVGAGSSWNGSSCTNGGVEATTCESAETGLSDTNTANFWMPDVAANQDFGNGNGQAVTATGTLTMNNLSSSQDACKNANLTLNFTA
ncbi:MAG TPA: hypothetical protein VKR21_11560 [Solirubrobacteraceae bacterium]|nr:hypothetical protein [Solirubrobacteraceae bacterium]